MNQSIRSSSQHHQGYIVKVIHNKKFMASIGNKPQDHYLVEWLGYPQASQYTWEPMSHLAEVKNLIDDFQKKWRREKIRQEKEKEKAKKDRDKDWSLYNEGSYQDYLNESESSKLKYVRKGHEESTFTDKFGEEEMAPQDRSSPKKRVLEDKRKQKPKQEKKKIRKDQDRHTKRQHISSSIPPHKKQEQKTDIRYGKILSHIYNKGEMFYEIERLNLQSKPIKAIILPSNKIKEQCMSSLTDYLQQYLIDLQEYNKPY